MAIHAGAIPCTRGIIFPHIRRKQEGLVHWRPHFLSDDVAEWKLLQGPALAGLQPKDLQIVRTGHEHYLLRFSIAAAYQPHADKELVAATLCCVFATVECKLDLVHVRRQTVWRCHLRHGAMKRRVPARVVSGMTRAAGIRTHITGDVRLDGTILRRYSFALEIAQRNQCENACGCNRCNNEQRLPPGSRQLRHNFRDRYYEKRGALGNPSL